MLIQMIELCQQTYNTIYISLKESEMIDCLLNRLLFGTLDYKNVTKYFTNLLLSSPNIDKLLEEYRVLLNKYNCYL